MVPAINLFVILYGTLSPWWRANIGRGLFMLSVGFALLVDVSVLRQFLDPGTIKYASWVIYSLINVALYYQLIILIRELRARYKKEKAYDDAPAVSKDVGR